MVILSAAHISNHGYKQLQYNELFFLTAESQLAAKQRLWAELHSYPVINYSPAYDSFPSRCACLSGRECSHFSACARAHGYSVRYASADGNLYTTAHAGIPSGARLAVYARAVGSRLPPPLLLAWSWLILKIK